MPPRKGHRKLTVVFPDDESGLVATPPVDGLCLSRGFNISVTQGAQSPVGAGISFDSKNGITPGHLLLLKAKVEELDRERHFRIGSRISKKQLTFRRSTVLEQDPFARSISN